MSNRLGPTQNFGGARLTSVGTPQNPTDGVNRQFIRYDFATGCVGKPLAAEVFPPFLIPTACYIPAGMTSSRSRCLNYAAASATWTLNKVNSAGTSTQLATLVFSANASTGNFNLSANASLVDGDYIYWIAPSTQDTNLADIGITVAIIRTA